MIPKSLMSGAVILAAALSLSACQNPNRYSGGGNAGMGGGAGGMGGSGIDSSGLGSASDPNSAAYFNQTVGDRVHFSLDQSTLDTEARNILTQQASWLNRNVGYSAVIEGHADEQGTREYNLALGARRAASAQQFLVSQGVAPNRLRTVSYGKERPIAVCSTEECYRQNRRAVTVLSVGAGV